MDAPEAMDRSDPSDNSVHFSEKQWHTPVAELEKFGLPLDILNALDDHGYYRICDMARLTTENVAKIKNLGPKKIAILKVVLSYWYEKTS